MKAESGQPLPVRMYQTGERVMVAAPLPGLRPEDIAVRIDGRHVIIHGEERGRHQRDVPLAMAEWAIGPYHREVDLPEPVDGALANATFGNGVLVLSMPKLTAGHLGTQAEFRMITVAGARGEHVGHIGRKAVPHTTEQHRREKHDPTTRPPAIARPSAYRRILVPLDGSPEAESILPLAEAIVAPEDGDLVLLRVLRRPGPPAVPETLTDLAAEAAHEVEAEVTEYLSGLAATVRARGLRVQFASVSGDPAQRIAHTARDMDAALIAMTTHGRLDLEHGVLGPVAEEVVRRAPVPVLLIHSSRAGAARRAA